MTMIEKYERFVETMKRNQREMQAALLELGTNDLSEDEREYSNQLMDYFKYTNMCISISEHNINSFKEKMNS